MPRFSILVVKKRALGVLLTSIALIGPVAHVCRWRTAEEFAVRSVASPLPLVFDAVDGVDYWAQRPAFAVRWREGGRDLVSVGRGDFTRVAGPHRWQVALSLPLSAPHLYPEALVRETVRVGICSDGPLARAVELGKPVKSVTLYAQTAPAHSVWHSSVRCEP